VSGLQFDNKISLGHIISIALIIFGGVTAYADLRSSQTQLATEVGNIARTAENREGRVRSVEIAQASQNSDLRAIQIGISEIKAALVKIGDRP
jgi:hypothetical protein